SNKMQTLYATVFRRWRFVLNFSHWNLFVIYFLEFGISCHFAQDLTTNGLTLCPNVICSSILHDQTNFPFHTVISGQPSHGRLHLNAA
ncbi:MAG: hypothetical protein KJ666_03600, partial [Bacteroidetes bacterium]|nr:hypothetical protein [Bacteroidota bacterium]